MKYTANVANNTGGNVTVS